MYASKMYNPRRSRRSQTVSVNVSHDVVSSLLFLLRCDFQVVVRDFDGCFELLDGFVGDSCDAELLFGFGEPEP